MEQEWFLLDFRIVEMAYLKSSLKYIEKIQFAIFYSRELKTFQDVKEFYTLSTAL